MVEWKTFGHHLDGPVVIGLHGDVHVTKFRFHTNRRLGLSAYSGKGFSGPTVLVRNLPERGDTALCFPNTSKALPSHLTFVTSRSSRNLSRTSVLHNCGSTVNYNTVGAPWNTALDLGPDWDLRQNHGFCEVVLER